MLEDGLDAGVARVFRVLEQHRGVLSGPVPGAYDPLSVDVGHQGSLPRRAADGFGAKVRKSLVRYYCCGSGIPRTVRGVTLKPGLDDRVAIRAGEGGPTDDVVYSPRSHREAVDRIEWIVGMMEVQ